MDFSDEKQSAYSQWPNQFKFTSIALSIGPDLKVIERQTYSILDWLGEVGGLYEALRIVGSCIASPFAVTALNSKILEKLFRSSSSEQHNQESRFFCLTNFALVCNPLFRVTKKRSMLLERLT